jgi:intracellular multiplication protein IcmK
MNVRIQALTLAIGLAVGSFASAQQRVTVQQGPSPAPASGQMTPGATQPGTYAAPAPASNPAPAPVVQQPAGAQPTPQVPPLPAGVVASPTVPTKPGAGMSPEEFATMLNKTMPFSPEQVREINKAADATKRARNARVGPAPRPVSVSARVTLDAGANPHVLRLSPDTVTSVVFTDVTGAPWNVVKVVSGAKDLLEVSQEKGDVKTHMFTITPTSEYVSTNLAVFLEGAPAPIMMAVETNQANVDFRVDVSVQARGPGAVTPVISRGLTESVSAELISMVAGVTPNQARPLKVVASDVPDVQAWVLGSRMFVRTKANVLTPAVPKDGKVATGADGTKVYELPLSPEVRLMSGGSIGRLQLAGFAAPAFLATK